MLYCGLCLYIDTALDLPSRPWCCPEDYSVHVYATDTFTSVLKHSVVNRLSHYSYDAA